MAAAAVVVVMFAATVAFNLFVGWKVESDTMADLVYAIDPNVEDMGTGRSPTFIYVNSDFVVDPSERRWYSQDDFSLVTWFSNHPQTGTIRRVAFDDWSCYAVLEHDVEMGEAGPVDTGDYYIAYIDTTGEQSLMSTVNTSFALIALLGMLIAGVTGYMAGRRIEQAQEAQKRFYENMSHDLKTPLAAIRGYAEGASSGVVETETALVAINREAERMATNIDQILGLSRLESKTVPVHPEAIDIDDFVQDCLMPFEGAVRSKGLDVRLDIADDTIEADRDLFEHAFTNLLNNAVRHAANLILITYDGRELAVWNDGDVPEQDMLDHLFDRFYTGTGGSTGIGLAIAYETAALHSWTMRASLEDGGFKIAFVFA